MTRYGGVRSSFARHNICARLKVIALLVFLVFFITPLRNVLVPGWPPVFKDMSTFKVIRVHLLDLFYYVDRSPYLGSCDFVHEKLSTVRLPKLEDMPFYDVKDWYNLMAQTKTALKDEEILMFDRFKPSLTSKEQQQMLYSMLYTTQALNAFNISYFLSEGSLIGYWRHHGMTPWDDDMDMLMEASKWPLARQVLSCLPDLQLDMGSDYMWKLFHKDSDLWQEESYIKFPFIDIFLYQLDSEHVWPLTIWMKTSTFFPRDWALPVAKGMFEGFPVSIPHQPYQVLDLQYGHVSSDCYSRTFSRRERQMIPEESRTHMSCHSLFKFYPFVLRRHIDKYTNTVLEERVLVSKVLSTFNTTFRGTLS